MPRPRISKGIVCLLCSRTRSLCARRERDDTKGMITSTVRIIIDIVSRGMTLSRQPNPLHTHLGGATLQETGAPANRLLHRHALSPAAASALACALVHAEEHSLRESTLTTCHMQDARCKTTVLYVFSINST